MSVEGLGLAEKTGRPRFSYFMAHFALLFKIKQQFFLYA